MECNNKTKTQSMQTEWNQFLNWFFFVHSVQECVCVCVYLDESKQKTWHIIPSRSARRPFCWFNKVVTRAIPMAILPFVFSNMPTVFFVCGCCVSRNLCNFDFVCEKNQPIFFPPQLKSNWKLVKYLIWQRFFFSTIWIRLIKNGQSEN